ncbi:unnamed protein product, partial [Linum tenue]
MNCSRCYNYTRRSTAAIVELSLPSQWDKPVPLVAGNFSTQQHYLTTSGPSH